MKWIKVIAINLVVVFVILEIVSRISIKKIEGQDYFLGKKWRYVLPFNYNNRIDINSVDSNKYFCYDKNLGWAIGRNQKHGLYYSNDKGYRCSKVDFTNRKRASSNYELACIGSSFTFCDWVLYENSWPAILSQNLKKNVLNLGVQAYGLDQSVLRLMNSNLKFDTVILGIGPNDFDFAVTSVYDYFHGGTKTKPIINYKKEGVFELINVPCVRPEEFIKRPINDRTSEVYRYIRGYNSYVELESTFWTNSMFLRLLYSALEYRNHRFEPVYITPSKYLDYCINVLKIFKDYCDKNEIYAVVVFLDNKDSIKLRADKNESTWKIVEKEMDKMGLRYLDFQSNFVYESKSKMNEMFGEAQQGHYSLYANQFLANLIAQNI